MKNPAQVHAFARIHGFRIRSAARGPAFPGFAGGHRLYYPDGCWRPCNTLGACVEAVREWLATARKEQ